MSRLAFLETPTMPWSPSKLVGGGTEIELCYESKVMESGFGCEGTEIWVSGFGYEGTEINSSGFRVLGLLRWCSCKFVFFDCWVSVKVCLKPSSTTLIDDVRSAVERMLEKRSLSYTDGPVAVPLDDVFLTENVQRICICDTDEWVQNHDILLFWQARPVVHVFQLSEEGACEDVSGDGQPSTFNEWILPAKEFDGMWESLIYESGLKPRLLRYAASALHFTEKGVNPFLVSWNRCSSCGKHNTRRALPEGLNIHWKLLHLLNCYRNCD